MRNRNTLPTLAPSLDHGKSDKVTLRRRLCAGIVVLLVSGCASYGVIENKPMQVPADDRGYSVETFMEEWRTDENALMLAFSGGGTRAAALSYGVLKELRDTPVASGQGTIRLLDEIHTISSVSGGSFTSAYYGLHGDGIFDDYEEVFLRKKYRGCLGPARLESVTLVWPHRPYRYGDRLLR